MSVIHYTFFFFIKWYYLIYVNTKPCSCKYCYLQVVNCNNIWLLKQVVSFFKSYVVLIKNNDTNNILVYWLF